MTGQDVTWVFADLARGERAHLTRVQSRLLSRGVDHWHA